MVNFERFKLGFVFALATAGVVACGGGGGSSSPATKTGYFIDSAVQGLEYTSGTTSGVTGSDGSFKYEEGKPVTFKIGSMVLGSLTVTNNRVFPVDLISGAADENDPKVTLMAQILQTLDSDADASNGITINETTRRAINQAIELATTDPSQTTTAINQLLQVATANRTNGPANALVSDTNAKTHLQANLIKEFAGTWTGSFTGSADSGSCQAVITDSGAMTGTCTSTALSTTTSAGRFTLTGSVSSSGDYTQGNTSTGAVFTGRYKRTGSVSGQWSNSQYNINGTWNMTKQ